MWLFCLSQIFNLNNRSWSNLKSKGLCDCKWPSSRVVDSRITLASSCKISHPIPSKTSRKTLLSLLLTFTFRIIIVPCRQTGERSKIHAVKIYDGFPRRVFDVDRPKTGDGLKRDTAENLGRWVRAKEDQRSCVKTSSQQRRRLHAVCGRSTNFLRRCKEPRDQQISNFQNFTNPWNRGGHPSTTQTISKITGNAVSVG